MENASKALIIAGAILLAILIISLGIIIFTQAQGVVNNNSMDEVEMAAFNEKFTQHEGSNIRGAQVNALINQIVQSNVASSQKGGATVGLDISALRDKTNWNGVAPPTTISITNRSDVGSAMSGKVYTVVCSTNEQTGFVNVVRITCP